mmetsp:Transcript_327/g.725  ORF Transcript_327/g.725 Transcript_327/m.725 type:complete len:256 (-) Transcript_327:1672-2439(-)
MLFYRVAGKEVRHQQWPGGADALAAGERLAVELRAPVALVEDERVHGGSQRPGTQREQASVEQKDRLALQRVELVEQRAASAGGGAGGDVEALDAHIVEHRRQSLQRSVRLGAHDQFVRAIAARAFAEMALQSGRQTNTGDGCLAEQSQQGRELAAGRSWHHTAVPRDSRLRAGERRPTTTRATDCGAPQRGTHRFQEGQAEASGRTHSDGRALRAHKNAELCGFGQQEATSLQPNLQRTSGGTLVPTTLWGWLR